MRQFNANFALQTQRRDNKNSRKWKSRKLDGKNAKVGVRRRGHRMHEMQWKILNVVAKTPLQEMRKYFLQELFVEKDVYSCLWLY